MSDTRLPPLLFVGESNPPGAMVTPVTSCDVAEAFELPAADEELAQELSKAVNLALKAGGGSKPQCKPRRRKRAGTCRPGSRSTTTASITTTPAATCVSPPSDKLLGSGGGGEQHCPENLGRRFTVELTTAAKAARIVRNRAFAKKSLERTKGRIKELEAENAALAAKDAALSRQLDAMLARAVARLRQ